MAHIRKRRWKNKRNGNEQVRWDAQVYVGRHPTTQKHQFLSQSFRRKADADAWITEQEGLKHKGMRPATTTETVAEYLEGWLLVHAEQVRTVTIHSYRGAVRRWVLKPGLGVPLIGAIPLRKLSVEALDLLYRHLAQRGIHRELQYLHGVLKRGLKDAVKKGILSRNPAEYATLPKRDHQGEEVQEDAIVGALTRKQADAFLQAAREDRLSAFWHTQLTGGLRPGETCALKWEHVDFEKGEVHVRHTLTRGGVDRKDHAGGWKLTQPKTPKSRRTVPLPEITMRELKKWKARQAEERLALGAEWQDHGGFVFTSEVGSPLDLTNLHRGSFRRVTERAGLGIYGEQPKKPRSGPTPNRRFIPSFRIYDLRHTCASLLLMDGEDLLVVSRRLGHSTIKLTADTYAHVSLERSEAAAARFDKMFGTA